MFRHASVRYLPRTSIHLNGWHGLDRMLSTSDESRSAKKQVPGLLSLFFAPIILRGLAPKSFSSAGWGGRGASRC